MKENIAIIIAAVVLFAGMVMVDTECSRVYGNEALLHGFVYGAK